MGRSRGGLTIKVHLRVDGLGNPQQVILTPGQVHDITQAPALMKNVEVEIAIADQGYDINLFCFQCFDERFTATRYEKTGQNFLGFFQLGSVMMLLR